MEQQPGAGQEGMEIVANFMANPFAAVSGAYGGLVETEPFVRAMSGSADVQVTGAGGFSASLKFGAQTVSFSGAFDDRGRFADEIVRAGQPSLRLVLALDLTDGSERLTGLIFDDTTTAAAINAERMISAAPRPGKYTALLERKLTINPSHEVSPVFPGIFTMSLDASVGTFSGKAKFVGIRKVKFDGVLLRKTGMGKGHVRFSDDTGVVRLGAP